ncbi:four-carbon acid sugar kinase family protein [Kibdelosporangium philippinense]|uniref:Four-carbon acid sugar kinase family protein n=1 Tax=Kibdelosporangium philippinense TaxID=211113 RepID=A0ABS8ZWE2_9PSEU|nr:four-carbon acid sugar kinase family protein [Kibdelosporangium philippinense]MCE7012050.1 four-carbon acid sugar kinase family protein [Kibdelosporangium philippinense]
MSNLRVLVIGDDLTGSNATGALFARFGMHTMTVRGGATLPDIEAVVVNLGNRHASPDDARAAVKATIEAAGDVPLVVKRVDTTLRGNVGAETDAAMAALNVRALVVPAFPDAGRVTVGGLHLVDGVPLAQTAAGRDALNPVKSSRVATILRAGTTRSITEIPLDVVEQGADAVAQALRADSEIVVCDATRNAHLRVIAEAAAQVSKQWLSVDSGPFGVRLAAALGIAPGDQPRPPVFAVVGSITAITADQVQETEQTLGAQYVTVTGTESPEEIVAKVTGLIEQDVDVVGVRTMAAALDRVLAAKLPKVLAEVTRQVLTQHRIGGLYATGGDIATAITAELDTEGFVIDDEVVPLAVVGRLAGGPFNGLPFATKGGLIGDHTAAVACIERLRGST